MNDLLSAFLHLFFNLKLNAILFIHFLVVSYFIGIIISVRRPVGVAFAWIFIVMAFPILGISLYILIGERPVGRRLTRKITRMNREYEMITETMCKDFAADREKLSLESRGLSALVQSQNGTPVVCGNLLELHTDSLQILQKLIDEINQAKKVFVWNFIFGPWAEMLIGLEKL